VDWISYELLKFCEFPIRDSTFVLFSSELIGEEFGFSLLRIV